LNLKKRKEKQLSYTGTLLPPLASISPEKYKKTYLNNTDFVGEILYNGTGNFLNNLDNTGTLYQSE
jgi:hypothetical protein